MLDCYREMLGKLHNEEVSQFVSVALVTGGRRVSDEDHRKFMREINGPARPVKAARATPGFLKTAGIKLLRKGGESDT